MQGEDKQTALKAPPQSSSEASDKPPSFSQRLVLFHSNFKTITKPTRKALEDFCGGPVAKTPRSQLPGAQVPSWSKEPDPT